MISSAKLVSMLRSMYEIRYFEQSAKELFYKGLIYGGIHPYIGQEGVAVGACTAIRKSDYIVSNHRGHGHCIAKGGELKLMMAELLGKESGYAQGRGGSMHIFDVEIGMLGANGIVGAGIPISVGAAFSADYMQSGQVVLCFFGDGAANQGTFHESLNMASLWKLPVVFICENNLYAVSTPTTDSLSVAHVAERASSYGFPGKHVDGNNVLAVYDAVSTAVKRARKGQGPSLIECMTYRYEEHCVGRIAPYIYRTRKECEAWRQKDPIHRFEQQLLEDGVLTVEETKEIQKTTAGKVAEAVSFAKNSPEPRVDDLMQEQL